MRYDTSSSSGHLCCHCIQYAVTFNKSVSRTLSHVLSVRLLGAPSCATKCLVSWLALLLARNVLVRSLAFSADRPDHLILFRTFVSRQAATKGRAVLEGVGLDSDTIEACFSTASEEDAVQTGLIKWKDGQGTQPPTWCVLLNAMEYAHIAQQHIEDLKKELHT